MKNIHPWLNIYPCPLQEKTSAAVKKVEDDLEVGAGTGEHQEDEFVSDSHQAQAQPVNYLGEREGDFSSYNVV